MLAEYPVSAVVAVKYLATKKVLWQNLGFK